MLITLPIEFKNAINNFPCQKRYLAGITDKSLKIYATLYLLSLRQDRHGYFYVSSKHLEAIYPRYYKVMKHFIDCGLIKYFENVNINKDDVFDTIKTKAYRVGVKTESGKGDGECMRYKFLIDVNNGEDIEVDLSTGKKEQWYNNLKNSLGEFFHQDDITISRDSYGRRVHHNAIRDYKKTFKGLCVIDAKCSQPRLLFDLLNRKGIIDYQYNEIFENDLDFYLETANKIGLTGSDKDKRDIIKKVFMFWVNGRGFLPIADEKQAIKHCYKLYSIYPRVSNYISSLKTMNYKNVGSLLQREESNIWINDLLHNLPVSFGVTIHDSLIVKPNDLNKVIDYCSNRYSRIRFEHNIII